MVHGVAQSCLCLVIPIILVSPFRSLFSLPFLFVLGGLLVAGCGATAPVIQSVEGPDTLETKEPGTFRATLANQQKATKPLTHNWRFGDGNTAARRRARHRYTSVGTYRVRFRVENEGGFDRDTVSVRVVPPPTPASITSINAKPNPADEGKRVRFTSNVQGDTPLKRRWRFGDGSSASGRSPTHTYEKPGEYTVRLTASNEVGEDSRRLTVRVNRVLPRICKTVSELSSAYFGRNSSTLSKEARKALAENASVLSKCPNLQVRVRGFAGPGERTGKALSQDRAQAAAKFYRNNGVPRSRITTRGRGQVEGVTSKKGGTREYRRVDSILRRHSGN